MWTLVSSACVLLSLIVMSSIRPVAERITTSNGPTTIVVVVEGRTTIARSRRLIGWLDVNQVGGQA